MSNKVEVHGYCDERFEIVKKAFAENFESGLDIGASLAITLEGKFVVDLWAGYADAAKTIPWEQDTIVNVYSTTKVMTAICVLMLVDRGLLDLDAPVAKYWPEFAQNGKEELPVRYFLSHTAGLPGWDKKVPYEVLYDWDRCVTLLASQKPWWEPGTKSGYHAITFGYLLGELVRRITGKTLGTFFREEIASPLKADFFIGLPEEHDSRVAELIPPKTPLILKIITRPPFIWLLKRFHIGARVAINPDLPIHATKTRAWRGAEIPAANGHGNARSIARIGAAIACGGELDGIHLLSKSTIEKALEEQSYCKDLVLGVPLRFGLGFALPSKEIELLNPRTFIWGGLGGSIALMDLDAKISFAFAMNKMFMGLLDISRSLRLVNALKEAYEAL